MKVTAYKTQLVQPKDHLFDIIAKSIPKIPERSILVIASKIISTCENRFVPKNSEDKTEKHELVKKEAEWYLDATESKYNIMLTVKQNSVWVNAGIDESNANNQFNLWPTDPQQSANEIWHFLRDHYQLREVGVTISDSTSFPLNWGIIGHAIAHCGFWPLRSYIGTADLFGREMKMEQTNIMQSITAAAVLEMGEGNESTPLALVEDVTNMRFQDHMPTKEELAQLHIDLVDDAFAPLLTSVSWKKGEAGKK